MGKRLGKKDLVYQPPSRTVVKNAEIAVKSIMHGKPIPQDHTSALNNGCCQGAAGAQTT